MEYNHGLEEKKFRETWKKQEAEYRTAGMHEEAITSMYEFERELFNSERRYLEHYEQVDVDMNTDIADGDFMEGQKLKVREKYIEKFSVSFLQIKDTTRFGWIEEIENAELYKAVSNLKEEDKNLLTSVVIDGMTGAEIAKIHGIAQQNVSKKIRRIKKILKKLSDRGVN